MVKSVKERNKSEEKTKKKPKKKVMKRKDEERTEAAFITGYKYHCENCDYIGPLVIERDIEKE